MKLFSKNPTHKANLSYNGFDCSHSKKFTSSVGQLVPVFYDFLITGDKVKVSERMFTRTQTLQTAAFVDLKEHIEYYFVPMTLIFSLFPQFRFSVGQPKSNMFDPRQLHSTFPFLAYGDLSVKLMEPINEYRISYPYEHQVYSSSFRSSYFEKDGSFGRMRLFNMLDFGLPQDENLSDQYSRLPANVWLACAYQKIYFDFYNIDTREGIERLAYNLDAWYSEYPEYQSSEQTPAASSHYADFLEATLFMFEQRYVPWKKDYFTGMYVSPLETANSNNTDFFGANLQQITDFISGVSPQVTSPNYATTTVIDSNATQVGIGDAPLSNVSSIGNSLKNRFTTGYIRKMFALEKLLSITRRSKDDYASLTAAHFGTDMSPIYSDKALFLGATGQQITINDVVATMNNQDTTLGDVAGFGVGGKRSESDTVEFTAPCDGVIMGVYYARPELEYRSVGLSRLNTWTLPSDLYTPEYSNLGLQPVFAYELGNDMSEVQANPFRVLGWQYRYSEFKSRVNKVYTGFNDSSLSDWTVAHHFDFATYGLNNDDYYVDPSALDNIMVESYKGGSIPDSDWNFSFDPLLHWFDFNYYKVSVMDSYGLPKL